MTLIEALVSRDQFSHEDIFFVEEPWTLHSKIQVVIMDVDGRTTIEMDSRTYLYFLEIFLINEFFEDLEDQNINFEEKCQRVISYAINDA